MELKEIEQDKQLLIGQKINKYKIIRYIKKRKIKLNKEIKFC